MPFSFSRNSIQINSSNVVGGTPGRIIFISPAGLITDDAGLAYTASSATLAFGNTSSFASLSTAGALSVGTVSATGLTNSRIPFITTGGTFTDVASVNYNYTQGLFQVGAAQISGTMGVSTINLFGGQIAFPATEVPSTNPNIFSDYQTGTWTPVDSSGAGLTVTAVQATYGKIGNRVFAGFTLTYPNTADGSAAIIGGFPFTSANVQSSIQGNIVYTASATPTRLFINQNATTLALYNFVTAVTNAQMSLASLYGAIPTHA